MRVPMTRSALAVAALLVLACGGTAASPAAPTGGAQGDQLDTAGIQAAVATLKANDSFQFTVTTYESGTPNYSQQIVGTQRSQPQTAVSATFSRSGQGDLRYVQIGNDVWYDAGTGSYTQTTASDTAALSQFQPYYLDGLAQSAQSNDYVFALVGSDTVGGVATKHYRLAESTVQSIVAPMNLAPADWAADVWISDADGSLQRLSWGPQSVDNAQLQTGFDYVVTAVDCTCPVDPPA